MASVSAPVLGANAPPSQHQRQNSNQIDPATPKVSSRGTTKIVMNPQQQNNETLQNEANKEGGEGYEIVGVQERHGPFRKAVPCMPTSFAVICCFFNVFLPGVGTILASFTVFCCGTSEYENHFKAFGYGLLTGFLQLIMAPVIVGWVWSIMWGVIFINLARKWWLRLEERDHTTSLINIPVRL